VAPLSHPLSGSPTTYTTFGIYLALEFKARYPLPTVRRSTTSPPRPFSISLHDPSQPCAPLGPGVSHITSCNRHFLLSMGCTAFSSGEGCIGCIGGTSTKIRTY